MLKSFVVAIEGLLHLIKTERNFRIHCIALVFVCLIGFYFQITKVEWIAVIICSGLVLALEAINTAIETVCDLYSKEINKKIKLIKDISAAGVLLASIGSAIVGGLVFWKYIFGA